ncbi:MAG: DUF4395 family protein [Armatimonadetes bacterium]|nr:DUF4395 family protein [Armatimonadota bacterium]
MLSVKPVSVSRFGFAFCRYTVTLFLWLAFFTRTREPILAAAVVMALSAVLTVRRAPLIALWNISLQRFFPGQTVMLDEHAMRFAHTLATVMLAATLALLYGGYDHLGRVFLMYIAAFKTIGAVGFCPVSRLYGCLSGQGGCCGLLGRSSHE